MRINFDFGALFRGLNTHAIGGVGLGTGLVSIAAITLQHPIDAYLVHAGGVGIALAPVVDYYCQTLAAPVLATAIGAAYFGRPTTIASSTPVAPAPQIVPQPAAPIAAPLLHDFTEKGP